MRDSHGRDPNAYDRLNQTHRQIEEQQAREKREADARLEDARRNDLEKAHAEQVKKDLKDNRIGAQEAMHKMVEFDNSPTYRRDFEHKLEQEKKRSAEAKGRETLDSNREIDDKRHETLAAKLERLGREEREREERERQQRDGDDYQRPSGRGR